MKYILKNINLKDDINDMCRLNIMEERGLYEGCMIRIVEKGTELDLDNELTNYHRVINITRHTRRDFYWVPSKWVKPLIRIVPLP